MRVGVNNGMVDHFLLVLQRDKDQLVPIVLCVSIHQRMERTSGDSGFKFPARVLTIYIPLRYIFRIHDQVINVGSWADKTFVQLFKNWISNNYHPIGIMARPRIMTRQRMMDKPSEKDDDDSSTEESTRVESGNEARGEEENVMEGSNTENRNDGSIRPEDMTIDIGSSKVSSNLSTLGTYEDVAKSGGLLSVIQKSKLMNWAEDNFLREYKILTFKEAAKKTKLHEEICNAIGIENTNWAVVGSEIIKRLRSALSDRVSLHRKVVKGLYNGKCISKFHIEELYIKLTQVAIDLKTIWQNMRQR
jgi:hypothetical protein